MSFWATSMFSHVSPIRFPLFSPLLLCTTLLFLNIYLFFWLWCVLIVVCGIFDHLCSYVGSSSLAMGSNLGPLICECSLWTSREDPVPLFLIARSHYYFYCYHHYYFAKAVIIVMPIQTSINTSYEYIVSLGLHFIKKSLISYYQQDMCF